LYFRDNYYISHVYLQKLEIRGAHFLIRSAQLVRGTRLE